MANVGPLTAEINWGTPAHFNGFRVLAALLYGTLVVDVNHSAKLCGVEQRAPPIFRRAAITFGIGLHSIFSERELSPIRLSVVCL